MARPLPEFARFVLDALHPLENLETMRMFGGVGLRSGGTFFAIVLEGSAYFVVDDASRADYEALGSTPFSYAKKSGAVTSRRYYAVPADVLEDEARLLAFARRAVAAARALPPKRAQSGA